MKKINPYTPMTEYLAGRDEVFKREKTVSIL